MKFLVTGAAGFIGSHLVDALVKGGNQVVAIDNLSRGHRKNVNSNCQFYELDICDRSLLSEVINQESPIDVIVHQASIINAGIDAEDIDIDLAVNVVGTINLLQQITDSGASRFVYASSVAVYGRPENLPATVSETVPAPIASYGIAKLAAENYVKYFCSALTDVSFGILRYANIFGPRQDLFGEVGVVRHFVEALARSEPITLHGDGNQTRDYLYVSDCIDATIASIHSGQDMLVNVGSGKATTVNRIIEVIQDLSEVEVKISNHPTRHGEIGNFWCDISDATRMLDWQPQTSLKDGIADTMNWAATEYLNRQASTS